MGNECDICGRKEGDEVDICGVPDGVPLGPIEICETCGRLACPDCMNEAECCFAEADEHASDPDWAPAGWVKCDRPRLFGSMEYVRVD